MVGAGVHRAAQFPFRIVVIVMGRIHLDYYATLEITPQASDDEVKRAYRRLALKYHPDRNRGDIRAEEKIRQINAAYEVLGDLEARRSYERLRFGGHGRRVDFADEAESDSSAGVSSPGVILDQMEGKLREEGRLEIFRQFMQDIPGIKRELAVIREETVKVAGYDKWSESIVKCRAGEVIAERVTLDMEKRRVLLVDIAVRMLSSQGVGGDRADGVEWLERRLAAAFHLGRIDGYCEACELLYTRR